ncbi:MAG TPA: UvrD-helicase domain-containing protein [Burkholderiales bacterium]|nr:UvrD-helicase domain-containing protein [Burkholderiales bacterium]
MTASITPLFELPDAEARERALDPARSFIVQAPAGSGKTELLVRRHVRLLGTVQRPEEVLAITFTRKAAAEMKSRVLKRLAERGELNHSADIAPRLRIMTIDSLCASLTRQLPVLARFGAQPGIAEYDDARMLYAEAATRTLALLEGGGEPARHVGRLLTHLDNDVGAVGRLLSIMLARRDQWLRRAGNPPTRAELQAAFTADRERLLARARLLHPEASPERAEAWLTRAGDWRRKPKPAPAELVGNEPLREALCALLPGRFPPERYADEQWKVLEAILALLKIAAAQLKLVFAERNLADFTEFSQGAVRALGGVDDPSDLLLRLDAGIRHILIDEFQDTSLSQWELLERLTAGWENGDGRTVFAVGDPMQSIYRFREAEVALFLHARRAGLGNIALEPLTLRTNFRSQAGIVAWVNRSFGRILPEQEDESAGAVPYSQAAAHPARATLPGEAARWHAAADRDDEARRVVELARAAQAEPPEGSCAILVRDRNALAEIVPALSAAGLRYRAVDIERLGEKQVVQDLYALTRALAHPADRVAWLALLRARWAGFDHADVHVLAGIDGMANSATNASRAPAAPQALELPTIWECLHDEARLSGLFGLSADARARLPRLRAVLGAALAQRLRGSLRERVEGAWLALGGPACVDSRAELEDAEIFFEQLDRLEDAGDLPDMAQLEQSLDELYAAPDLDGGEAGLLQVMTIHKAKGLEFDTVIVPGLDRAPRSGERPLLAWKSQVNGGLLLAPINAAGDDKEPLYNYVRAEQRRAEDAESGRLLYVAATRAKARLHLLACVKQEEDGQALKAPLPRSLLKQAWCVAANELQAAAPGWSATGDAKPEPGADYVPRRLPAAWRPPAPPPDAPVPRAAEAAPLAEQIEFSWAGETARHVGSVVHRWLQRLAESGLERWDAESLSPLRARFRSALAVRGVDQAELDAAAERVAAALANALRDPRGRWLLGPQPEARNEYRITAMVEGERRHLVIDRTFVAGGRRWIVDYKTSSHEGTDVEAFLDRERERYRAQLERYAAHLPGELKSLGLYFPMLLGWREW